LLQKYDDSEKDLTEKPHEFFKNIATFMTTLQTTMNQIREEKKKEEPKKKTKETSSTPTNAKQAEPKKGLIDSIGKKVLDGSAVNEHKEKREEKRHDQNLKKLQDRRKRMADDLL
jgi:hypothetical protein